MSRAIDARLFDALEKKYGPMWPWPEEDEFSRDPFKNLVMTVLSQNTSDENCARAYKGLSERFEVTPETLASAREEDIRDAIRPGGLYNIKAKRLKELARITMEKFDGDLTPLISLPKEEARQRLIELPGIGDKTADVLLTYCAKRDVIPIDTHMDRVAKRLGLTVPDAKYEEVQEALMKFLPPKRRRRGHGLLWLLAKYTCKAPKPRCSECPLENICEYPKKTKVGN